MLINYRVGEQFIIGNMEHIDNLDKRMGNDMANQQDTVNHSCHVTRKPIFGVCDQVRLKLACSTTESS